MKNEYIRIYNTADQGCYIFRDYAEKCAIDGISTIEIVFDESRFSPALWYEPRLVSVKVLNYPSSPFQSGRVPSVWRP